MKILNIVVVGTTNRRAAQYIQILTDMGHNVNTIESIPVETNSLYEKIRYKFGFHHDKNKLNKKLLDIVEKSDIDIVFDCKSLVLRKVTIEKINKISQDTKIAFFSEDDMMQKHNNSKYFLEAVPYYNVIFTTKSYNVKELSNIGAKKVYFQNKSFDENYHKPIELSQDDIEQFGSDVSFVGTFEKERADILLELAKRKIKIIVWGDGWKTLTNKHKNLIIKNRAIYSDDFIKVICASKINLNFLRKTNRDLQTDRSVEIPACKSFMLTERTSEHKRLFAEGKEAEFFDVDDIDELEEKINYYLNNDEKRKQIAQNGYLRCISSGYSHQNKLVEMLKVLDALE